MRAIDIAFLTGRVLLGAFFIVSSLNHFLQTAMYAQAAAASGVPASLSMAAVLLTGVLLLVGGLSVAGGAWPRVGLACIALFMLGVTPMMHAFWAATDPQERLMQWGFFLRNVALLGASLALYAVPVPWVYGIGGPSGIAFRSLARRKIHA